MDRDTTRVQGMAFGDLEARPSSTSFPATGQELCDWVGEHEVELMDGSVRVESALEAQRGVSFESAGAVVQTLKQMVERDALGRVGYSDRGLALEGDGDESF